MLNAMAWMVGHFVVHQLASLPSVMVWIGCALVGLLAFGLRLANLGPTARRASAWAALAGWLLIGVASAGWRAQLALDERLPESLNNRDLRVVGEIVGLPQLGPLNRRFRLRPLSAIDLETERPVTVPSEVALSWTAKPRQVWPAEPKPGEVWRFTVHLRAPHSLANPGLFDAELRALEDGVGATGSVRAGERVEFGPLSWRGAVDGVRDRLRRETPVLLELSNVRSGDKPDPRGGDQETTTVPEGRVVPPTIPQGAFGNILQPYAVIAQVHALVNSLRSRLTPGDFTPHPEWDLERVGQVQSGDDGPWPAPTARAFTSETSRLPLASFGTNDVWTDPVNPDAPVGAEHRRPM
ncbi:MAG: DUF4131 domain-containing protein, partial [Betaproteobacteria bacterium]|nr:DUF4131 domain-containing protein [Betaproteobacteria bacterium]